MSEFGTEIYCQHHVFEDDFETVIRAHKDLIVPSKKAAHFNKENKFVSRQVLDFRLSHEEKIIYKSILLPYDIGIDMLNVNFEAREEWVIDRKSKTATVKIESQTLSTIGIVTEIKEFRENESGKCVMKSKLYLN